MALHAVHDRLSLPIINFSFNTPIMQKNILPVELGSWSSHMTSNPQLPFGTVSALINLKELEDFIAEIKKQQADSVRVYFLRFITGQTLTQDVLVNGKLAAGCKWQEVAAGFTQASIAMVPTKNFTHDEDFIFAADDIVVNGQITALFPGTEGQGTALNPPAKPISPKKDNP